MLLAFFAFIMFQPADSSSVEWIRVWFSQPPYGTVAASEAPFFSCYLMDPLIARIDSATASIDLAAYDIENNLVVDALVRAKKRGVRIRVATDNHMRTDSPFLDEPIWETFRANGIISIDDDGDVYWPDGTITDTKKPNAGAQMHHKFAVFDRDTPSPDDDYVWTGSTNITLTCVINTNTVLVIKDPAVARVYREEFEQLWGGPGDKPVPEKAAFHKDKKDVSQHFFGVGQTPVEVYFAPVDRGRAKPSISDRIVQLIKTEASHEIAFGAFSISSGIPVSKAMWEATENTGVRLLGTIDRRFYSRYKKNNDLWASEEAKTGNRSIAGANELRILHSKTILIDADADRPDDVPVIITGSYNFSNAAEFNNDENLLVIRSKPLAAKFHADYMGIHKRASGEMQTPAPDIDPKKAYPVASVLDGGRFEVEITHGFTYEIRLLGVDAPYVFSSSDSVSAFAETSSRFLNLLLEGGSVYLSWPGNMEPTTRFGAMYAYATAALDGKQLPVNRLVLESGMGKYARYLPQEPDSVLAFSAAQETARKQKKGIWAEPSSWSRKQANVSKLKAKKKEADLEQNPEQEETPPAIININTATAAELETLPRIGPAAAAKILELRAKKGRFRSIEELGEVKGIGPKTLEQLRPLVKVD